jgi:hypothetical protein
MPHATAASTTAKHTAAVALPIGGCYRQRSRSRGLVRRFWAPCLAIAAPRMEPAATWQ